MTKWIFLSHFINESTPMYGNDISFQTQSVKSIKQGDSCNTSRWIFSNHTGTHIDCPFHFYEKGRKISDYTPDFWIIKKSQLIDINTNPGEIISISHFPFETIAPDIEVLMIKTGFYRFRNQEKYWQNNPGLHPDLSNILRNNFKNLKMIGIDFISVSSFQHRSLGREAHKAFLSHDQHPILLIEDMNLSDIESKTQIIQIFIAPILVENADASPCTVITEVQL